MADQESGDAGGSSEPAVPPGYTGPRTLDGRPVPEASRSGTRQAAAAKKPQKKTGLVTLSSLGGGSGHGHGHDHDEDEEDDSDEDYEDERGPRDLFAGGEKSGLAVQDPAHAGQGSRKLIHDIIAKAKQ